MAATELWLEIGLCGTKSRIIKSYFTSPLKLGTPKTGGGRLKVVLMMASAGVLKGDLFEYDIQCHPHTKTLITEQSYTKLFDTGDEGAVKTQHICVGEGASLFYCPQAVIPFAGSSFDSAVTFDIEENSELLYTDIVSAGRVGMGERFAFRHYHNRICVRMGGKPIWIDNCLLEPKYMDMENMMFFDRYTHMGTLYYYHADKKFPFPNEEIFDREAFDDMTVGISKAVKGVCLRVLAHCAQDIEVLFGLLFTSFQ